jgi:hypothetical protein
MLVQMDRGIVPSFLTPLLAEVANSVTFRSVAGIAVIYLVIAPLIRAIRYNPEGPVSPPPSPLGYKLTAPIWALRDFFANRRVAADVWAIISVSCFFGTILLSQDLGDQPIWDLRIPVVYWKTLLTPGVGFTVIVLAMCILAGRRWYRISDDEIDAADPEDTRRKLAAFAMFLRQLSIVIIGSYSILRAFLGDDTNARTFGVVFGLMAISQLVTRTFFFRQSLTKYERPISVLVGLGFVLWIVVARSKTIEFIEAVSGFFLFATAVVFTRSLSTLPSEIRAWRDRERTRLGPLLLKRLLAWLVLSRMLLLITYAAAVYLFLSVQFPDTASALGNGITMVLGLFGLLFSFLSTPTGYFLIFIALGFTIYWTRSVHRMGYGIIEAGVGIGTIWLQVGKGHDLGQLWQAFSGGLVNGQLSDALQLAAGLYVVVRGLDNIEKGLEERKKEKKKYREWRIWRALFYSNWIHQRERRLALSKLTVLTRSARINPSPQGSHQV